MTVDFRGVIPALVTPFSGDGVDYPALRAHVGWLVEAGVNSVVACGTTGESPTLSHDEHDRVVAETVEAAAGRIPVLAGTGSNSTAEAISLSRHARQVGAAGLLLVSPYYNKPTQEGLYGHFVAIAESAGLPVILYNIPSRCGVNILPETLARLAEHELIIGVKEATGDLNQMIRTIELCGPDFLVTCGDDGLTLPLLAVGGGGVISVAANIIPGPVIRMWKAWEAGRLAEARASFYEMLPFFKSLFLETNPIPLKFLMGLTGRMSGQMRPPMGPPSAPVQERLRLVASEWATHFPPRPQP
ncbi:MAG: 4-hydroxy-tetrahydrodipicolinate synthase [Deltaproteobacteria bacterium]|jgi:4-hydroxy-tetrahydrodipicolinate synthase|nr:4-hydroxy-tetrahydrodipicolinate synthase [Deltaproteobacteria bacterium]